MVGCPGAGVKGRDPSKDVDRPGRHALQGS